MEYPTIEEVEKANRERLCRWYRFLPSLYSEEKVSIMDRIVKRWREMGGFTPEISKRIGWDPPK